jgi:hypothetical protein
MSSHFSALRSGTSPYSWSAVELQQIILAERLGRPFLVWRDAAGIQQLFSLGAESRVSIGRHASNRLALTDSEVSRTHAELEFVGADWTITDDGLSRNGTWLNDNRLAGRHRGQEPSALAVSALWVGGTAPEPEASAARRNGHANRGRIRP